jgi:prepilin peptidase CpaA
MISWIYWLILTQLIFVSIIDVKIKKISNLWFLANLLLGFTFHFLYPEAYPWDLAVLVFPIGWIIIGFLLFVLGIMGAGDSKYLASLFLVIPVEQQAIMLEKIIYSTLIVGFIFLTFKIAKDFQKIKAYALSTYWQGLKESVRSRFSYAPVILLAWILLGVGQWP